MASIETNDGVELYVKEWGEGRPVVMAHGWPLSADTFDDLAMAIADAGMRAITYDRRGFGRSAQPWDGYDYDTLADDLAAVIEQTDATDATLVGFSMGGGEVARYLSRYHASKRVTRRRAHRVGLTLHAARPPITPNGVDRETFDQMSLALIEDRAKFWSELFTLISTGLASSPNR